MRRLFLHPATVLIAALLAWQIVALVKTTPLFPGPLDVVGALWEDGPRLVREIGHTLRRAFAGFALAALTMIPLGLAMGRIRALAFVGEPLVAMLATLPPPATVPVVMLFAGTGDLAKILVIAYAAAVPLVINAAEAARNLHPMLGLVGRSLRLTRLETLRLIALPSALPMLAVAARMAASAALLVSITSEMLLSSNGIGNYLQREQENFRLDAGLAGIVLISVVGLILNRLIAASERRWLGWHYQSRTAETEA
ncbi:ABC transporter permease subunit [Rhodobacter capsulatus]|uniref:ABC transporter permease subunit n=1 Tax=Rhodobacter capsulatus TaxID=1061 RepID=A0A4U1JM72_RHOCA|nr:ABC transporter permease subunit [Rhodobacter capsulatus]TKD14539.1 ABC transporter permease subunit [Rhodobacter capsulatus]